MRRSLRTRLLLLWIFIAVTGSSLAVIMVGMYREGAGIQIEAGQRNARDGCAAIQSAYAAYRSGASGSSVAPADLLYVLVERALFDKPGVEGGVWDSGGGFLAYAYPTYEGSVVKRDVPEAEQARIASLARQSIAGQAPQLEIQRGQREASIVAACPLVGSTTLAAWTLKRVPAALAQGYDRLALGLGLVLAFVLGSGVWLGLLLYRWSRRLTDLEQALGRQSLDHLPELGHTGEQEIDRIIDALNGFSARLRAAVDESTRLAVQLAQADRLAALGRMAAVLAHEIRNPISAMRLRAENAIPEPGQRQQAALEAVLTQIQRLEKLLADMLAMTQPLTPRWERVKLPQWLDSRVRALQDAAERRGVQIKAQTSVNEWAFDSLHVARAVDNLLWNSLEHSQPQSQIRLDASQVSEHLVLRVSDDGSGVPAGVEGQLFEPFVSGRPDGSGLGLAIVREIALAHGGSVRHVPSEHGACFELEIPWHAS
jgi:signal transduction histidine kinase